MVKGHDPPWIYIPRLRTFIFKEDDDSDKPRLMTILFYISRKIFINFNFNFAFKIFYEHPLYRLKFLLRLHVWIIIYLFIRLISIVIS